VITDERHLWDAPVSYLSRRSGDFLSNVKTHINRSLV